MRDVLEWHLGLRNFISEISLCLLLYSREFHSLAYNFEYTDFCGIWLCCLQYVRSQQMWAWVNWIMRLQEWKACSSWAKMRFLAFFCSTWGHACFWIIWVFDLKDGGAHDLLCISVSLCCPDCCVLLWAWFAAGCSKFLVVLEEARRDV